MTSLAEITGARLKLLDLGYTPLPILSHGVQHRYAGKACLWENWRNLMEFRH